jgi:hypothetical protein
MQSVHYVLKFISDLRQVSGFLRYSSFIHQWNWRPRFNWHIYILKVISYKSCSSLLYRFYLRYLVYGCMGPMQHLHIQGIVSLVLCIQLLLLFSDMHVYFQVPMWLIHNIFFNIFIFCKVSSSDNKSVSHWIMFYYFFHAWKVNIFFFLIMFLVYSCSHV